MIDNNLNNSKSESPIEERFWIVAQHKIKGLKQQYSIVHGFFIRVDFAIPDVKLIIECDGYEYHNRTHKMRKRDYFRDKILKFYGWKVIRLKLISFYIFWSYYITMEFNLRNANIE